MFGSDAFLLARIANAEPEGALAQYDLSRISPAFLPLAERLIVAGHHQRRAIWEEFLARGVERTRPIEAAAVPEPAADAAGEPARPPFPSDPTALAPLRPMPASAGLDRGVRMTRALDLKAREIEWLWAGRVPLGMMTMFAGDPKLGKSYVTLAMAAALSRGLPLPSSETPNRPGSAILIERRGRSGADDRASSHGGRCRPGEGAHPRIGRPRQRR